MPGTWRILRHLTAASAACAACAAAASATEPPLRGPNGYAAADRMKVWLTMAALLALHNRREQHAALLNVTAAALACTVADAAAKRLNHRLSRDPTAPSTRIAPPSRAGLSTGPPAAAVALAAGIISALPGGGLPLGALACAVSYAGTRPGEPGEVAAAATLGLASGTALSAITHRRHGSSTQAA